MRKLILTIVSVVPVIAVLVKRKNPLADTCKIAHNPYIGTVCIHHPQRWKVWRRGKRTRVVVHYTTASEPARSWDVPFKDAGGMADIGRLGGEDAVVAYCEIYGTPTKILP